MAVIDILPGQFRIQVSNRAPTHTLGEACQSCYGKAPFGIEDLAIALSGTV